MPELTGGALLDAVRGVHWPSRRLTSSALHGAHRSRRAGASPEFLDYRAYQQGDDPAKIDWRLFARSERVAIRLAHDDSSVRTMVVADASASMAFPGDTRAKWETAAALSLGLCAVAQGDGDPVGLAIAAEGSVRALPPRTRRGTLAAVLRMLVETDPAGVAPLAPVVATLRSNRRIAIVSDFLGDAEALIAQVRELVAAGHEVYAVHVVAAEELDPKPMGMVVDPEYPAVRRPLAEADLAAYRTAFAEWRESLASQWRGAGASYQLVKTGEPVHRAVRRIVTGPDRRPPTYAP